MSQMSVNVPGQVSIGNRGFFNQAGKGRSPGSFAFIQPATGEAVELFFGECVTAGRTFGLCKVIDNSGLPMVRVRNELLDGAGPIRLGMALLIGPLQFLKNGPNAESAWPAEIKHAAPPYRPTFIERLGTISAIKPGYGFIQPADGSADVFWHISEIRGFTPYVGCVVKYTPAFGRGPQAKNVRLA